MMLFVHLRVRNQFFQYSAVKLNSDWHVGTKSEYCKIKDLYAAILTMVKEGSFDMDFCTFSLSIVKEYGLLLSYPKQTTHSADFGSDESKVTVAIVTKHLHGNGDVVFLLGDADAYNSVYAALE